MHSIDPEVLAGFVEEVRSYLPQILASLDAPPAGREAFVEAHRLAHSIKGAASMVGLPALSNVAYFVEEALEDLAEGRLEPDTTVCETIAEAVERIDGLLGDLEARRLDPRESLLAVAARFRRLRGLPEAGDEAEVDRLLGGALERPALPEESSWPPAPSWPGATDPGVLEDAGEVSPELLEAFQTEAEDHLAAVERALAGLYSDPDEPAPVLEIRRAVHTLKGAAALVGARPVARLAHRAEDLLDRLHDGSLDRGPEVLELLRAAVDALTERVTGGGEPAGEEADLLWERFDALLGPDERAEAGRPLEPLPAQALDLTAWQVPPGGAAAGPGPSPPSGPVVRIPLARLEELVRLAGELIVHRSTFEQHVGDFAREVAELDLSTGRLRRVGHLFETAYEVAALGGGPAPWRGAGGAVTGTAAEFDELEFDRYTEFHQRSRELSETGSDIAAIGTELSGTLGDFDGYLVRLGRLTGEIQDRLMRLRLVPMAQLGSRLHRAVRVTAARQGKAVDLVLEGGEVELDKSVLEAIADPLVHLLRNAVDHGIEPPALRRALGKPERGRIRLRAGQEGTQVVLRVADDGAGIEPEAVRRSALAAGLLDEAEAAAAAETDLLALLFTPGFSTAASVSEISGRGVGLDVVRTEVERLRGTVALESSPGRGTEVVLRLPSTLAVLRVLLVEAADQTFAVPLAAVGQIVRLEPGAVERLGDEPVLAVGGQVCPLARLSDLLQLPEGATAADVRVPVLVLALGERRHAVAVDRLAGARDVVVKPLGPHLRRVHGVTGATLRGDGSVVLILDPHELVTAPSARPAGRAPRAVRPRLHRSLDVLLVDDSLSVRRVLANLVRGAGWNPIPAKDGVEALEILQRSPHRPDVILLDIEMPRMGGYELAATLRTQEALRDIPIVVLTSRRGAKHREKAFEVGVSDYLTKPIDDEALLAALRRATRARDRAEERSA